ncbi:hypothetical protein L1987_30152 [Smallanthus sonchifolius]|uniref:Uncharacterized protein n=1 Tax=Smallanthus sonchifolius TaxID=185202 RepID=A0ACB9I1F2_9ASTR|nr:hypothetical protein L1987_30152 [Smallanthus sonchifolius]
MMKAYFKFTEHTPWESIVKGPHVPKTANADGLVSIADQDLYSEEDKKLIERDNRALDSIIFALSTELVAKSRTDLLLKQYNMFKYKKNETLSEQVIRFTTMINRLKKMGVKFEEYDLGKKLLDSLPDFWSKPCMLIKNTTPDLKSKSLDDIICLLESYELDAKKRELNNPEKSNSSGSTNASLFSGNGDGSSGSKSEKGKGCCEHSAGEKVKSTGQIPEDQIALFGAFMNKLQFGKKDSFDGSGVKLVEMIEEDEKSKKAPTTLMSKQLKNCEWDAKIEDAEEELDDVLMAEIEVSEKVADDASDCALKTDNKGKGKAIADSDETYSDSENDKLKRVNKELKHNEVIYTRKIKTLLKDECVNKQRTVYIRYGLGYNKVPHPDNFVPFPERHESNELISANDSNFLDMYVSADVNIGSVEDESELDGVKSFSAFNKQCIREFIRDCKQYLDVDCDLNRFVNVCEKFDVNNCSDSDISFGSICSTNVVCNDSDCVSEVSTTSTFFDKVVHKARDYIPIHKVSSLAEDVVLDEFGNPLIQEYDLSHEKPKKYAFIEPENHILMSDQESKRVVKVKISAPKKNQNESSKVSVKGKSVDIKGKFIDVKDKPAQSKGCLGKGVCVRPQTREPSLVGFTHSQTVLNLNIKITQRKISLKHTHNIVQYAEA